MPGRHIMDSKKMLEERANVWSQMTALRDKTEDLTAEERASWDAMEVRLTDLTGDIEREQRAVAMSAIDYSQIIDTRSNPGVNDEGDTAADYRAAFDLWARFGEGELTGEQRGILRSGKVNFTTAEQAEVRAAGVATGAAGGFTVPPLFRDALIERLKFYSSVRQEAEIITTDTGASLPWMTNNDTGNVGAILAENTAAAELDATFGTATLDAYMYTSLMTRVSLQLIQDTALDIDSFLPRKLGERIGRIQNQHFTTGTGTAQPLGLITGGTAVAAAVGNVTSFSYDSLVDAPARLDPAYLSSPNLAWMGSQSTLAAFRKLKDTQGRPLWEPSLQVGDPDSLLGYRYVLNNDMAVPAANAKSLAFGDFRAGYVVRDVVGLQTLRLSERYAEFLQVAFLAFQRSGGTVQDTAAYTVLTNSAT